MNNISIDEVEQKIDAGEEVIDRYFEQTTTRVGKPHLITSRRSPNLTPTDLDIPQPMLKELEEIASELNISREAVIKMILRRALDEYYLAKSQRILSLK